MILTLDQIKDIIINNPNKAVIDLAKLANKKLRMHLYGEGLKDVLTSFETFEKDTMRNIRRKYARSNKDLFIRLARPLDKVYTARGGSIYYNLPEAQNKAAVLLAMNEKDGLSVRKWIQFKWQAHLLDDPNGLIFMEIGDPINGVLSPYPTYKSITTIYDYQSTGITLDYVCFIVADAEKVKSGFKSSDVIYRLVDDNFDYWIMRFEDQITILQDHSFPNYFEDVPAMLNSDLLSPQTDGIMLSLFSDVIELADDFLQTGSVRNLAKIRMAYPKYWEYADDCPECHGTTQLNGTDCIACKGSGKKMMLNPGDAKVLTYPTDKETPIVAPNIAGFVAFPQEYFDYATMELQDLENMMTLTIWGTESSTRSKALAISGGAGNKTKTATEIVEQMAPKADRLQSISEMAEKRHKFIIDKMIQIVIDINYEGSSINYGRRFLIESVDSVWDRYSQARLDGGSENMLDELLMEFVEIKYSSDPVGMSIQLKLLRVEPFIHYTIQQLQLSNPSFQDYNEKLYYGEWKRTLNNAMLISYTAEQLCVLLTAYVIAKNLIEPQVISQLNLAPDLNVTN